MCNLQQLSFFEQCVVMRTSCKVCWSTPEACQITCCLQIAIITLMRQVIFTRQVPSIHFLFLMIPRHNHHFLRLFGTCGMFMQLETLETNSHNLAKFLLFNVELYTYQKKLQCQNIFRNAPLLFLLEASGQAKGSSVGLPSYRVSDLVVSTLVHIEKRTILF